MGGPSKNRISAQYNPDDMRKVFDIIQATINNPPQGRPLASAIITELYSQGWKIINLQQPR